MLEWWSLKMCVTHRAVSISSASAVGFLAGEAGYMLEWCPETV